MKNIVSYKMKKNELSLKKLIEFHFICQQSDQQLYVCQKGKSFQVHRMTELILSVMTENKDEVLIVVEGDKAHLTMGKLIQCVFGNASYSKEARPLG